MAISIRGSGGWHTERETRLNCLECRRMDGLNGCLVRGGACSVSTSVQLTPPPPPSSPALGYRASPKVSSCQTGQDLDLVAAHGEPRYDIGIGFGLAPLARWPLLLSSLQSVPTWAAWVLCRLQALGAWATSELFPAALRRNFLLPSTWSILLAHTHTHAHACAHLFSFSPRTSHSPTPHDHADLTSLHAPPPPPMSLSLLVRMLQPVEQFELSFSAA